MGMHTWDPRKNENYLLKDFVTGREFSSLSDGYFVIETSDTYWGSEKYSTCLSSLLVGVQARYLSVVITPWRKEKDFRDALSDILKLDCSLKNYVSYSVNSPGLLKKLLKARENLGSNDSGEWLILGSKDQMSLGRKAIVGGFSEVLEYPGDFEFLFFMSEMKETFLILSRLII